MVDEPVTLLDRLRRQRALLLGLGLGALGAVLLQRALDPARWFPAGLGRVYVAGTCSYSRVAVDMLAADPGAPWVALPLPVDAPEFDAPVCHQALARLQTAGTWWLAFIPEASACARLQHWTATHFELETPAQGFPAWVDGDGKFRGFGVDPGQIASLHLTPTEKIIRFWIEGGYERSLVEGLGFAVPFDVEQGLPLRSPPLQAEPHVRS